MTTKTAIFSIIEGDIVLATFLNNNETIDLEEAKEHIKAVQSLVGDKKAPVLVDATQSMQQLTPDAKKYLADNDNKTAEAILVKALHQRIIASFYLSIVSKNKNHPVNVFTDRAKAIQWLKDVTKDR